MNGHSRYRSRHAYVGTEPRRKNTRVENVPAIGLARVPNCRVAMPGEDGGRHPTKPAHRGRWSPHANSTDKRQDDWIAAKATHVENVKAQQAEGLERRKYPGRKTLRGSEKAMVMARRRAPEATS